MPAQDAITQYVDAANGVRYAYRRFGRPSGVPLACHMHFRGNMDWWDPVLLDTIASLREVIIFDAPGVGRTAGDVPDTFQGWADDMLAFLDALGVEKLDLLGHSMGSRAVQMVSLTAPHRVRKLILAGSNPIFMTPDSPKSERDMKFIRGMVEAKTPAESREAFRLALFPDTDGGRVAFERYQARIAARQVEKPILEPLDMAPGGKNQIVSTMNADKPENIKWPDRLRELKMPVLVANGDEDTTLGIPPSWDMFNRIETAQLVMYPKSGHGFLFHYPVLFGNQVNVFLDTDEFGGA